MARREWRPDPVVDRAAESVLVLGKAVFKHVVGADTSRETQRLDELARAAEDDS